MIDEQIKEAQRKISNQITPYLRRPLERHKHQVWALKLLKRLAKRGGKIRVIDIGCGIGLLGIHLLSTDFHFGYIGIDKEEKFLRAGREMFLSLGYWPQLYKRNFLEDSLPGADAAVLIGYEDELVDSYDYHKIFDVLQHYETVLVSIVGYDMWEYTKLIETDPFVFIAESRFEEIFGKCFLIRKKKSIQRGRILYWLQKRQT